MHPKVCKDCGVGKRPAPYPGPRCATHHRLFKREQKARVHDQRVVQTYGLQAGEYEILRLSQGGFCAICGLANGKTKRLAVDHNHATGAVRGLLCGVCNQFIGYIRDSVDAAKRMVEYLERDQYGTQRQE